MSEAMVKLNAVGKSFGARRVLRDIEAQIRRGAIVALVGASGSGKTTLVSQWHNERMKAEGGRKKKKNFIPHTQRARCPSSLILSKLLGSH